MAIITIMLIITRRNYMALKFFSSCSVMLSPASTRITLPTLHDQHIYKDKQAKSADDIIISQISAFQQRNGFRRNKEVFVYWYYRQNMIKSRSILLPQLVKKIMFLTNKHRIYIYIHYIFRKFYRSMVYIGLRVITVIL